MNKKIIIGIAATISLMLPLGAFAATSDSAPAKAVRGFCKIDTSKLTEQQKTDFQTQMLKMMELKKETTQKMMENGTITKEQGAAILSKLEEIIAKVKAGDLQMGKGMKGDCHMREGDKMPGKKGMEKSSRGQHKMFQSSPAPTQVQ